MPPPGPTVAVLLVTSTLLSVKFTAPAAPK
jgi:hypothetical protein